MTIRHYYIYIPESSQVHRCNGKIFDRNEDGDMDITDNTNLVSAPKLVPKLVPKLKRKSRIELEKY